MKIAEMLNVYNCCPSSIIAANEDIFDGDPISDVISMSKYESVLFIIVKNAGATGTATCILYSCDNFTPSTATAMVGKYKVCTSGNTWGAWTALATTGFTTTAGANQCYMILANAEDLVEGDVGVKLAMTEVEDDPCDGAVLCIGVEPRYSKDVLPDLTTY